MYTAEGKISKQQLVEQYYPLVRKTALKLKVRVPESVELDDLIQSGMIGLLSSFERYDASAGVAFTSFAHARIQGAMIDELRTRDWLPRRVRRSSRELEACIRDLEQKLGRAPEDQEIATAMGLDLATYRKLLGDTNAGLVLSLDEVASDIDSISETLKGAFETPDEAFDQTQLRENLVAAIQSLPEREMLALTLYYQEGLNLKEIAKVLEVSESRVSQLHSQAIKRIQSKVR